MNAYHLESRPGKALCGEENVSGIFLVDKSTRVDCPKCRRAALLDPLPAVAVRRLPPRDTALKAVLEALCLVMPHDRQKLADEALAILEGRV